MKKMPMVLEYLPLVPGLFGNFLSKQINFFFFFLFFSLSFFFFFFLIGWPKKPKIFFLTERPLIPDRRIKMDKVREIALKVLYEIDKNEAYSNIALDETLKKTRKTAQQITNKDIGFISEIVYGTVSWKLTIDEIIKKYSNIRLKKISPWILNILRMSIYQILLLDKVPKSAAVNEGVNLAKRYGHKASSNFVNAILRKVEKKDYEEFFQIEEDIPRISKTTSMPEWLVEELLKENSVERVEKICQDSNLRPKVHIRINSLRTNKEELIKELEEKENSKVQEGNLENFLILEMAEMMKNKGEIIAWDLYEHRANLVDEAAKRLGITIIQTEVKDASKQEETYFETFDKILLDVPCLGIGVLKRKPDIKWKRKKEDIEKITRIQQKILATCSKYLKVKGELVYSTCSILKEENEKIIEKFLENNKSFEIVKIGSIGQKFFEKFVEKDKYIKVYQNEETDGFFICKMRKKQVNG